MWPFKIGTDLHFGVDVNPNPLGCFFELKIRTEPPVEKKYSNQCESINIHEFGRDYHLCMQVVISCWTRH